MLDGRIVYIEGEFCSTLTSETTRFLPALQPDRLILSTFLYLATIALDCSRVFIDHGVEGRAHVWKEPGLINSLPPPLHLRPRSLPLHFEYSTLTNFTAIMSSGSDDEPTPTAYEIIFSCSVCQATISDIYRDEPQIISTNATHNGNGSTEQMSTKLWLTECAHLTCGKHLDHGGMSCPRINQT